MAQDYLDEIQDRDDRVRNLVIDETTWTLKAHNPYGLVKITNDKGPIPEILSGNYTGNAEAEVAIRRYAAGKLRDEHNRAQAKADRIETAIYKKPKAKKEA